MNWDAISAIAEVAGLIIIVASLIYIGVQTKQSNITELIPWWRSELATERLVLAKRIYSLRGFRSVRLSSDGIPQPAHFWD